MARPEQDLKYPVALRKLELQPNELEELIDGKVKAIWGADRNLTTEIKKSSEKVKKKLCRRTNRTDPSKSDGRQAEANENYQLTGAAPDQKSSPAKASQDNSNLSGDLGKACHEDQDMLFHLLKKDGKLDRGLAWSGGNLKRGENYLSAVEFCNTLDEATHIFLNEKKVEETGSCMSRATERRMELREIHEICNKICTARAAGGGAIVDDIFTQNGYSKWKKHANILASFGALLVSLTCLLGPETAFN
ncbi:hypothetical protein OS493_037514 [Desmophyllum pertusum]|uniref:Uncharacterized protein n=1 Tax=Desmophyllum pertusum TaxID=174260 RepID=A0A9W9ZV89_9CNID|nr:hypothetical protein OS493_037514 [Desmophyllum pertusum]